MIISKTSIYLFAGLGVMIALLYSNKATAAEGFGMVTNILKPRGIRNNNPGNIRHGSPWQGMAKEQTDKDYIQFLTPEYGIRAISKTLSTYANKYNIKTVRGIISRWAPPSENDTESYIQTVADKLGVTPTQTISIDYYKAGLIEAIVKHENGQQPYSVAQIKAGSLMA